VYKLNRRITIFRYTTVRNEFGGLVAVETGNWTKWAEARDRQGTPRNDYQQREWTYDQVFIMRYETERPTRSNDVINYEGEFYKINSVQIRNEGNKEWEYIQAIKLDESINSDAPMDLNQIQVYNYLGIGGETTFTYNGFIGRHVFNCFKDGIQFVIITSGSPVGKEVLVDSTTGELTWGLQFEDGEYATVLYY
jgi:SPP1 family predicted phage head-tail adaptor